ncbi:MAG: hypothetical protein CVT99_01480 [Bacteroidetes bacterium HGW-Bacteroidetes-16]|jgi:hypothetical protein|nr:MAG: hypothetical protein CVT99_01480 [Bacteroidetes bacterium HGW-Bacteroidetes-16]
MKKTEKKFLYLVLILLLGIMIFLTFNRHSKSGYFNYHSEIWADKAGYYVYLPATFKYAFNPDEFPDSMDVRTGYGFSLDLKDHKIRTKYTCGVALMQIPFYFLADVLATPLHQKADGFSPVYHWAVNVAAVFYLLAGILFLYLFLRNYFKISVTVLVLASLVFGTNLYYYAIDETGMSHVYSFALFSGYLYLWKRIREKENKQILWLVIISMIAGLIILLRPLNVIFLVGTFFLDVQNRNELKRRLGSVFQLKTLGIILISVLVMLSPQLFYWKYLTGSFISYSYGNEGFNWLNPQLMITWFSPKNGLLLYTPLVLIMLFSIGYMIFQKQSRSNGVLIGILFLVLSYVLSCWWQPEFGCSFGARNFVEYYALFALALGYGYQSIIKKGWLIQSIFWLMIALMIAYNLKMTYSWDGCFYGVGYWDWNTYWHVVVSET